MTTKIQSQGLDLNRSNADAEDIGALELKVDGAIKGRVGVTDAGEVSIKNEGGSWDQIVSRTYLTGFSFLTNLWIPADGSDYGLTFNRAFTAGIRYIALPIGTYGTATQVNIPAGAKIVGLGGKELCIIQSSASIDMFVATGNGVVFEDVTVKHLGASGRAFDGAQLTSHKLINAAFTGEITGNTSDVVRLAGSFCTIENTDFTNLRTDTGAYALRLDRRSGVIHIETTVSGGVWGGVGRGIWLGSSDGSARPEGIKLVALRMIMTGRNIQVREVLSMDCLGCVFDQTGFEIRPGGQGIQGLSIVGGYLSSPSATAFLHTSTDGGSALGISITGGARVEASTTGVDVKADAQVAIDGAHFFGVATPIKSNSAGLLKVVNNSMRTVTANNFDVADGASGGQITIKGNSFDSGAGEAITQTDATRWHFDDTNTGRYYRRVVRSIVDATAGASGSLNIPINLSVVPTWYLTGVAAQDGSSGYSDLRTFIVSGGVDPTNATTVWNRTAGAATGNIIITVEAGL